MAWQEATNKLPFILRPPRGEDVLPYTACLADPEVTVWLDDLFQRPVPAAQVEAFLFNRAWCPWSIECEGAFTGLTGLDQPDLTRGIARFFVVIGDRRWWGQGLGTAILARVVEHGFYQLGLRKINSDYLEPNQASRIIHDRNGFVTEGRLRADAWRRGRWVDRVVLSLLRTEYEERKAETDDEP